MSKLRKRYLSPGIFLLALVLRLFYLGEIRDTPYFDTPVLDAEEYDRLSTELLGGNWLLDNKVAYVHGPLYTYVFALIKLCGFHYAGIRIFQAVLGALSCVLVAHIAGCLFPRPIPLLAGLVAAGYWPFIFYNGEILATTLVIFIELVLAALLLHNAARLSLGHVIAAGILLALLIMTRSNTLLLLPVLLWWIYRRTDSAAKPRNILMLAFSLAALLALSPFLLRNQLVQGTLLPFQGSWSLHMGNNPEADGTPYARQGLSWQRLESQPFKAGYTTPAARGRFFLEQTLHFVREQPIDYLYLIYSKIRLFWNAFEIPISADMHYYEERSLLGRILLINFGVVAPLALAGMLWGWRRQPDNVLLCSFVLVYLATGLLFSVCARYRLPATPFLIIFAAQGFWQWSSWVRSREFTRAGAFALLLVAAVALVHTGVDRAQVDHLRSSWLQGQVYFRNQQYDLAEQAYLRRVGEDPNDTDALNSLGAVYQIQGRVLEAEAEYKKAVEIAPDHSRPWLNLGDLYVKQRRLSEARTALQTALRSDPRPNTQYEGHYYLGYVYLFQHNYQQAYQAFTQALASRKQSRAYYALANACARLELDEEQVHALEQAVQLEPEFAPAYRNLGMLYLERGDFDEAEKALLKAIEYEPDSAVTYRHLGALYMRIGQRERAREAFSTARRLGKPGASP